MKCLIMLLQLDWLTWLFKLINLFSPAADQKKLAKGKDDSVQYEAVVGLQLKPGEQQEEANESSDSDNESNSDGEDEAGLFG